MVRLTVVLGDGVGPAMASCLENTIDPHGALQFVRVTVACVFMVTPREQGLKKDMFLL